MDHDSHVMQCLQGCAYLLGRAMTLLAQSVTRDTPDIVKDQMKELLAECQDFVKTVEGIVLH